MGIEFGFGFDFPEERLKAFILKHAADISKSGENVEYNYFSPHSPHQAGVKYTKMSWRRSVQCHILNDTGFMYVSRYDSSTLFLHISLFAPTLRPQTLLIFGGLMLCHYLQVPSAIVRTPYS